MTDSGNDRYTNDYDPEGGHTREEADAAYAELFRELHGMGPDSARIPDAYSLGARMAYEYMNRGVVPDEETARRLCADIISDTQMFRAEGTTQADRLAAAALANIAGADIEELAREMDPERSKDEKARTERARAK